MSAITFEEKLIVPAVMFPQDEDTKPKFTLVSSLSMNMEKQEMVELTLAALEHLLFSKLPAGIKFKGHNLGDITEALEAAFADEKLAYMQMAGDLFLSLVAGIYHLIEVTPQEAEKQAILIRLKAVLLRL